MKQLVICLGSVAMWLCSVAANADPLADGDIPVDVCDSLRLADKCKPAPLSAEDNMREATLPGNKLEIIKKISLPAQEIKLRAGTCEAHYQISYAQMDDRVKVETSVVNETCAASHGDFALRIRTLSEAGEAVTRSFPETWSRPDGQSVAMTSFYPMGNSRDLIWVKVRSNAKTSCICD